MNEESFKKYLIECGYKEWTPSGNKSTVYDYCKRIYFVCQEESLAWQRLYDKISNIVVKYDLGGEKEDLGNKSHRAVINALNALKRFKYSN